MNDAKFNYGFFALKNGAEIDKSISALSVSKTKKEKTSSSPPQHETDEENISALPVEEIVDEKEQKRNRVKSLIKLAIIGASIAIVIIISTIAWFTMNREVENSGLAMTATDAPFELKTAGSAGLYDSFLDDTVSGYSNALTTDGVEGIKWKLVKNNSELNNVYSGEGSPDMSEITRRDSSDYGLKPGDSGTLRFTIVRKQTEGLTVDFNIKISGYSATFITTNNIEYKTNDPLTFVNDEAINHYLLSHVLLFYKGSDNKKHLITSDGFSISVSSAETDVVLYWVWPATLKEILEADINNLDDTDASKEIRMLFFEHPEKKKKTQGTEDFSDIIVNHMTDKDAQEAAILSKLGLVNGREYNRYGTMYNDADQTIGDNMNYMLVELSAEKEPG